MPNWTTLLSKAYSDMRTAVDDKSIPAPIRAKINSLIIDTADILLREKATTTATPAPRQTTAKTTATKATPITTRPVARRGGSQKGQLRRTEFEKQRGLTIAQAAEERKNNGGKPLQKAA